MASPTHNIVLEVLGSASMAEYYYRNNRTDLKKNVRCFPMCSPCHMQTKFCGTPFRVKMKLMSDCDVSTLRFYGEFMLEDDSGLYGKTHVQENALQNDNYYSGAITEQRDNEYVIEFNKDCDAWCYGWTSNKQRTFFYHVFQVTVLQKTSTGVLTPVAVTRSPHFNIFSSRRRKDNAPQSSVVPPVTSQHATKKRSSKAAPEKMEAVDRVLISSPMERVIVNCKQILIDAQQRLAMYKQVKADKQQQRLPIVAHAGVTPRTHSPVTQSLKLHTAVRSIGPLPVKLLYDPIKLQDCDFDSLFGEGGTSETRSTCSM